MNQEFSSNVDALFNKLENILTSKTVVGEPIHLGDTIILPLVDISFGVGAGGSDGSGVSDGEKADTKRSNNKVGAGAGAKISPSAVIVINNGNVQLVSVKNQDSVNKIIDLVPGILSKFNLNPNNKVKKDNPENATASKSSVDVEDIMGL